MILLTVNTSIRYLSVTVGFLSLFKVYTKFTVTINIKYTKRQYQRQN